MELTVRQAARLLGLSQRTVYRMVVRGELPAYQVHDEYRFNRTELLEWALANRVSALDAILEENVPEGGPALPTLGEALAAGGIVYDLEGADKPSALKALVRALPLPENVDRELLLRVLIAREALGSTGMGGGVAVPHVRNPIVLRVPAPQVTPCTRPLAPSRTPFITRSAPPISQSTLMCSRPLPPETSWARWTWVRPPRMPYSTSSSWRSRRVLPR